MDTQSPVAPADEITEDQYSQLSTQQVIAEQMERITGSAHFRNSKRYPALLRYIVEETLAGRGESLKERTLGLCVFDRSADYDTNMDPVVRVSAGEVRKRIAQFYQAPGHDHDLRIEIPLGSYIPRFYRPAETAFRSGGERSQQQSFADAMPTFPPAAGSSVVPTTAEMAAEEQTLAAAPAAARQRAMLPGRGSVQLHLAVLYVGLLLALGALGLGLVRSMQPPRLLPGVNLFWGNILRSPTPTLIVLGVHSFDEMGRDISASSHASMPQPQQTLLSAMTRADMVHLSDVTSYSALTRLLTTHMHSYRTQGAEDTTLEQLRQSPFILIGGFNNLWTTRTSQQLRFRFVTLPGGHNVIQDSQYPERVWTLDNTRSALSNLRDYGLLSCFYDPETEQYAMMAGGIGKSGTEAAADFLTNEKGLEEWLRTIPAHRGGNVQVVVSTDVIEGKHGPPHVTAYNTW